jgi:hypothetical protein
MGAVFKFGHAIFPTEQNISDEELAIRREIVKRNQERDARYNSVYPQYHPTIVASLLITKCVLIGIAISVIINLVK